MDARRASATPGGWIRRSYRWSKFTICFFFSSRRRHTRWNCDWSSDVCLPILRMLRETRRPCLEACLRFLLYGNEDEKQRQTAHIVYDSSSDEETSLMRSKRERIVTPLHNLNRSEERRVGKESRSRWEGEL